MLRTKKRKTNFIGSPTAMFTVLVTACLLLMLEVPAEIIKPSISAVDSDLHISVGPSGADYINRNKIVVESDLTAMNSSILAYQSTLSTLITLIEAQNATLSQQKDQLAALDVLVKVREEISRRSICH